MTSYHKIAVVSKDHLIALVPPEHFRLASVRMELLHRRRNTRGMLLSIAVHAVALAVMIWRPPLFAYPVIIENKVPDNSKVSLSHVVLTAPVLPKLTLAGASVKDGTKDRLESAQPHPMQPKRDYAGPQEIISAMPDAVNHIQSILRPDLPKPANLKFPLQLNTMMFSRPSPVPLLAPREPIDTQPANPAPPAPGTVSPLVVETKSARDKITNKTRHGEALPPPSITPNDNANDLSALAAMNSNSQNVVLVVNAVHVPADVSDRIPDGQLAGSFTVGPSPVAGASETKSAGGGKTQLPAMEADHEARVALPHGGAGAGTDSNRGTPGAAGGNSVTLAGNSPVAGGNGAAIATVSNNAPAKGKGAGSPVGISISGGVPDRNHGTSVSTISSSRSYGLTVISGGSSGGASRDVGFFNRTETVFSVVIPMSDAGGGPDWPMQYALLNRDQSANGLPSPPLVKKKMPARMARQQLPLDNPPLFIGAIIDENGRLTALRALRSGDARSPYAISALSQWEFLPAQLEGRPVACKVLIGITVVALE